MAEFDQLQPPGRRGEACRRFVGPCGLGPEIMTPDFVTQVAVPVALTRDAPARCYNKWNRLGLDGQTKNRIKER